MVRNLRKNCLTASQRIEHQPQVPFDKIHALNDSCDSTFYDRCKMHRESHDHELKDVTLGQDATPNLASIARQIEIERAELDNKHRALINRLRQLELNKIDYERENALTSRNLKVDHEIKGSTN